MNNQDRADIKRARNVLIRSNDSRFNYDFIPQEDIDNFTETPEIIDISKYDWSFKTDEGDDWNLPTLTPASLIGASKSLEDVEEWYRQKFPALPDEYHGVMARYSTNSLLTKKEIKNGIKKIRKDPDKNIVGLSKTMGNYTLNFD